MMKWKVKTYKTRSGKETVIDFIKSLSKKEQGKFTDLVDELREKGISLGFPKTSAIKGYKKLRELIWFKSYKNNLLSTH